MNKSSRDTLIAEIRAGLALPAGAAVIWSQRPALDNPAAKQPARPYATLEIVTSRQISATATMPRSVGAPADDLKIYTEVRQGEVAIAVFMDLDHDALEALERLQRRLKTAASRSALRAAELVITGPIGGPRDASTFGNAAWEGRAELDLGWRQAVEYTVDEGVIEAASFEGELDGSIPILVTVDTRD